MERRRGREEEGEGESRGASSIHIHNFLYKRNENIITTTLSPLRPSRHQGYGLRSSQALHRSQVHSGLVGLGQQQYQ